jgi:3'(2'), 5'-bisphosphate nucleotidase
MAIAQDASVLLMALRAEAEQSSQDLQDLRKRGDLASHELIVSRLSEARPHDAVLSEEQSSESGERFERERVWIVDPLDGTKEYGQLDRLDWAVHIALWVRGAQPEPLRLGVVALPASNEIFVSSTVADIAGFVPPNRILVSNSRAPQWTQPLAASMECELVGAGSAGFKTLEIVRGNARAYVHGGGQYEWDSAAPVAIAKAAGLHASRIDGSDLLYNQQDPYLPDLLICHKRDVERMISLISSESES